jgi:glutamate-1-semialdehyde aminotransferase
VNVQQATVDPRFAPLIDRYVEKTKGSREAAARTRPVLADVRIGNRIAAGWKEIVYPIVCDRSQGSRLWDIDGNEYVDLTCGFGVHLLGHNPAFVRAALEEQLARGLHLGAENELAGEVAEAFSDLTGMPRLTFVNTGSEAVQSALRFARTVTGRSTVALFRGSYHGWYDGLATASDPEGASRPGAPGIPQSAVDSLLLLDYDSEESIARLEAAAGTLAAILVEPVQSRHPDVQPSAFLRRLREVATTTETPLVFDEMVTGFRIAQGGAGEYFGVRPDLATYGKLIGAGLPIGVVAGDHEFLDAVDGGAWSYGDDSMPAATRTMFAGTFSRNPLSMAAARAVLGHLRDAGPDLQGDLSRRAAGLVDRLESPTRTSGLPFTLARCGPMFRLDTEDRALRDLLSYHLVLRGVFACETFTWHLSTAHDDADLDAVHDAIVDALAEIAEVWT